MFDKIKLMVNKILSILSEENFSVSLLRSTAMLSQVKISVGCHTDFSELTIKPALVNGFEVKVDFFRSFSKIISIPKSSSKKKGNFDRIKFPIFY